MAKTYDVTKSASRSGVSYTLASGDTLTMDDAGITLRSTDYWPIAATGGDIVIDVQAGRLDGVNGLYLLSREGDDWIEVILGDDARISATNAGIWSSSDRLHVNNSGVIEANLYGIRSIGTIHDSNKPVPVADRFDVDNGGTIRIGANGLRDHARGIQAEAGRIVVRNSGTIEMVGTREGWKGPVAVDLVEISTETRTILTNTGTIYSSYHAVRAHNQGTGEAIFANRGKVTGVVDVDQLINSGTITGTVYIDGSRGENSGVIDGKIILTRETGAQFDASEAKARIVIDGSVGRDRIDGSEYGDRIYAKQGADTVLAGGGKDYVSGHDGNDRILGGKGDDTLYGGGDNDTLAGNEDHDELYGQDGEDLLQGHSGNDSLSGGGDNDMLTGGSGDDTLDGGSGNDRLITSQSGSNLLIGGSGRDVFVFYTDADGRHVIDDFEDGRDRIDLSNFDGIDFGDIDDALRQSGDDVILDLAALGGEGSVRISGTDLSDFSGSDFIFA